MLWLWGRLAAPAPIQPLTWELPYAVGAAQKKERKRKERKKKGKERKGRKEERKKERENSRTKI